MGRQESVRRFLWVPANTDKPDTALLDEGRGVVDIPGQLLEAREGARMSEIKNDVG